MVFHAGFSYLYIMKLNQARLHFSLEMKTRKGEIITFPHLEYSIHGTLLEKPCKLSMFK